MALPEGEVLGVDVSTLQEVEINDIKVTGTSKYVESFPKFSRNAKGNFLALKCDEATKGETIDEDGILVVQLTSNTQTVTFKNGETSKQLDLTGLTLSPAE